MLSQLLPFSPTNLIATSSSCDARTRLLTTSSPSQPRDEEIYAARPMQPSAAQSLRGLTNTNMAALRRSAQRFLEILQASEPTRGPKPTTHSATLQHNTPARRLIRRPNQRLTASEEASLLLAEAPESGVVCMRHDEESSRIFVRYSPRYSLSLPSHLGRDGDAGHIIVEYWCSEIQAEKLRLKCS
jgi:hypothetical protein